jgi:hypothetical protein
MERGEEGVWEDSEMVVSGGGGRERASRENWPSKRLDLRAWGWSEASTRVSVREKGAGVGAREKSWSRAMRISGGLLTVSGLDKEGPVAGHGGADKAPPHGEGVAGIRAGPARREAGGRRGAGEGRGGHRVGAALVGPDGARLGGGDVGEADGRGERLAGEERGLGGADLDPHRHRLEAREMRVTCGVAGHTPRDPRYVHPTLLVRATCISRARRS